MFTERLEEVRGRIDGAVALSLVAKDGIPVESVTTLPDLDLELVAAELMSQIQAISLNHRELGAGPVRHFSVRTDRMVLMVTSLSEEYSLLLVTQAAAHQGRARFELRRAVLQFEKDLS